jgi:hypothetical protein
MNSQCTVGLHDYEKVYPDQDLIAAIIFEQSIEDRHNARVEAMSDADRAMEEAQELDPDQY